MDEGSCSVCLSLDVDLVIDDLFLESASFIPDSIKLVAHNDFEFVQGYATCESTSHP